jgi:hypothetical protein
MHAKNNRLNKDFQIAYFLAGSCHTADGAYSLLKDLQEDREMSLAMIESSELKQQAKILKAQRMIDSGDEVSILKGKSILMEAKNTKAFTLRNIEAAKKELEFINKCIEKIQPHRRFKDLPDPEAHEAAQYDEWKMELISRAENSLLTNGNIPTEHFVTMRMHPAFIDEILPAIEKIRWIASKGDPMSVVIQTIQEERIDIPKLLELNQINLTALSDK